MINIEPRIEIIEEKIFIGMYEKMSLLENKTFKLFSTFMPRRKEILNAKSTDVIDLKVYPKEYFLNFNPSNYFTKWALIEVANFENTPKSMQSFTLSEGEYAVFKHQGLSTDNSIFEYIYGVWLPNSDYILDDRPHFDVLGEKYDRKDPNSEQEIWIPINLKK